MNWSLAGSLNRLEKCGLAFLIVVFVALGGMVEYRSAFLTRRMGDLDVFLRAGWAVRTGEDPYSVTSDNDWHYLYPPLYAILLTPLADAPPGAASEGYVRYPISVAICFLINVTCMVLGVHTLASALEERVLDAQPKYCRRWWWLRVLPIVICVLPIGHTLMRGQVNVIVLAALCAALAGWIRGQSVRAGLWLALPICIKVIPAFLLVYPLWKRDGRALAGCAAGLIAGLVLIPGITFGPTKTVTHYQTYGRVFFGPFLKLNDEESRKEEILGGVNATESVGVRNALHNWMFHDLAPGDRPADLTTAGKVAYLLLGFTMTFLTLWPRNSPPIRAALVLGCLVLLMAIFSPVCHSHYLLFALPIVMGLLTSAWQNRTTTAVPRHLSVTFAIFFITMAIAYLPGMEILKDRCAALFATLPLWAIPIAQMWTTQAQPPVGTHADPAREIPLAA